MDEMKDYIEWCMKNGKKVKDAKSLTEYLQEIKNIDKYYGMNYDNIIYDEFLKDGK